MVPLELRFSFSSYSGEEWSPEMYDLLDKHRKLPEDCLTIDDVIGMLSDDLARRESSELLLLLILCHLLPPPSSLQADR